MSTRSETSASSCTDLSVESWSDGVTLCVSSFSKVALLVTDAPLLFLSQLFMVFLTSSGVLASSISFNAMSEHGTCTVVFAVVAAIIIGVGCSARTFKQISWLGWAGLAAIVPSILIVVIACGVSDRPPAAPAGPFDKQLKAFNNPSFVDGMVAVVNVLFAYCGTPGFFSVIAEMKVRASLLVLFSRSC